MSVSEHCDLSRIIDLNRSETLDFIFWLRSFGIKYSSVHGYICVVLCTYGIVANVINIVVLTRPWMRTTVNLILSAIAICDIGTMATYFIYVIYVRLINRSSDCHSDTYSYGWLAFILFHSLWSIQLHTTSLWLAVLLALLRLCVIRRSRLALLLNRSAIIGRVLASICASVCLFMTPIWFVNSVNEVKPVERCSHETNLTLYTIDLSRWGEMNNCLLLRMALWIIGLLFKLLPCICLSILIVALLHSYREAQRRNQRFHQIPTAASFSGTNTRQQSTSLIGDDMSIETNNTIDRKNSPQPHRAGTTNTIASQQQPTAFTSRTTVMLAMILLIFVLTEFPQAFLAALGGFFPDIYFIIYPSVGEMLDLLSLINSSVNLIVYCGMSSRFRATFMHIFFRRHINRKHEQRQMQRLWQSASLHNGLGLNLPVGMLATPEFKRHVYWRRKQQQHQAQEQNYLRIPPSVFGTRKAIL